MIMSIDLSIITNYGPQLLLGFWMTIKIVVGAIILGMPFGLILALGRRSKMATIRFFATSFIEVFRNTPFIIQVFMFFYVLPFYGLHLPAVYVGVLALAAFGSAYFAEVIRGGIDAVAKGNWKMHEPRECRTGRRCATSSYLKRCQSYCLR